MQVTETVSDGLKREYKVVIPADDMAQRIDARFDELQRTIKLKGFRPGKVPVQLLKKQFGQSVLSEVVQQALQDSSGRVITDHNIRPALQPRVEEMSFDEGTDLAYTLAVEVMPQIETGDFSAFDLERLAITVSDDEVSEAIDRLVQRSRSFVETAEGYAAQSGDSLRIAFEGKVDGVAFEGGKTDDHMAELGAGRLLPEFEQSLEGHKAGDSFTIDVTFPDDYGAEHLAGKTAQFDIIVKEVRQLQKATLDEEFAKRQGAESVEDLKSKVRERLGVEYGQLSRQRLKRQLLDRLAESHDFEVPPTLVNAEFDAIWRQVEQEAGHHHHDHDHHDHDHHDHEHDGHDHDHDHHDHHDHDHDAHEHDHHDHEAEEADPKKEAMRAEYRDIALRRVRLGLLLSEIGRTSGIQVTAEDMQQAVIERARQFPGQEAKVVQYYQQNPQAVQELTAPILEERVVDHVLAQVKISERPVSPQEFFNFEQADETAGQGEDTAGEAPAKKKAKRAKSTEGESTPAKKKAAADDSASHDEAPKKPKASKKKKTEDEA